MIAQCACQYKQIFAFPRLLYFLKNSDIGKQGNKKPGSILSTPGQMAELSGFKQADPAVITSSGVQSGIPTPQP